MSDSDDSDYSVSDGSDSDKDEDEDLPIKLSECSPQFAVAFGSMKNLPQEQKNVIRIFLSSTFTDMKVERNMLMSSVFPKLKKYCQNYKLEFQVVDMRWGVQDQASDDHSTSELCMKEILNCQKESAGPNFVCLLGERYGTRYLKKFIAEVDWTILVSRVRSSEVKQLLDVWYKLDTNSATSQRILQPISSVENGPEQWDQSSALMYSALKDAAIQAMNDGELLPETAQTFIRSVTEEEINCAGMLSDGGSEQKSKCLAFIRRINNINLQHDRANRFTDLTDTKEIDEERQGLLSKLKDQVKESLPTENVKEYSINWSEDGGFNAEVHKDYLKSFGEDFYEQVKRLVDSAVEGRDQNTKAVHDNEVTREILGHSKQAIDKLSKVVPRSDILDKVQAYITGKSDRPLIVHGHSGCGKTSIMASVAKEAGQWLSAKDSLLETAVVLRFLGTTPASSDIEIMLQSIIAQVEMIRKGKCDTDYSSLASKSMKDLLKDFKAAMLDFPKTRARLVVVIDSVDQLRQNDVAFNLSWIPDILAENVKFIISTLPDIYGILKSAQSLNIPKTNFVEVKALEEKSAWTIIDKWLAMSSRKLSKEQRDNISKAFKNRSLPPLYIKLIFDILIKWTSYGQTVSIPTDVAACMDQLFNNLENTHGKLQVQLALAYLTYCPGGISETELEDTLSIDDDFLTAVYQYHIPPVRRIPATLWVRIKNDIRDYLVEKESLGVAALFWYHRQFIEYATKRYAGEEGGNTRHCMEILCEYFTGKWSDADKPFVYTDQQKEKLNLSHSSATAPRYVATQPTKFGRHSFNGRKISVLSQLWSNSLMKDEVYRNSAAYLMDIEFLTGKFLDDSWHNINTELSNFVEYMNDEKLKSAEGTEGEIYRIEFNYIHAVLKMFNGLIAVAPLTLSAQLFACLQDKYNLTAPIPPSDDKLPNLAWFLTQLTSARGIEMCPLLPTSKILTSPGGMQRTSRLYTSLSKMFPFIYQGKSVVAVFADEMMVYVLEEDGGISELMSIALPSQPEYGKLISFGKEDNYVFGFGGGSFCLISLENKRVEFDGSDITVDPDNEDCIFTSDTMNVFYNPLVKGKDSIMFYAVEHELAVVYSFKQRKVVWFHFIPEDAKTEKRPEDMYHASLHDTDKSHIKTLVIVFSGRSVSYQMTLLQDGGVGMIELGEKVQAFQDTTDKGLKLVASNITNENMHAPRQMDVILPELPRNRRMMLSDRSASAKGIWSYFELNRTSNIFMVGKLKCGLDLIATHNDVVQKRHIIELYTVKTHDHIELSAIFSVMGRPSQIYLVPDSDVLVMTVEKMVSVYFLSVKDMQDIEVRMAFEFMAVTDEVDDMWVDSKGLMVAVSQMEFCCKIWDLVAYNESSLQKNNPRVISTSYCMGLTHLDTPDSYALALQEDGSLWDVTTNKPLVTELPAYDEDDQPIGGMCTKGEGSFKHTVVIVTTSLMRVLGVNPPTKPKELVKVELLERLQLRDATESIPFDRGMIAVNDESGRLYVLELDKPKKDRIRSVQLRTTKGKTGADPACSWKSVGFSSTEYCYAGDVLFVSGDECDPRDDDADPVSCLLIYDTDRYELLMRLETDDAFSYAAYMKTFKLCIFVNRQTYLTVTDVSNPKTLNREKISIGGVSSGRFTMLDTYDRNDRMYNTDTKPYFYIYSSNKGLIKLDVRVYKRWPEGEGVAFLGHYPTGYSKCRLSFGCEYLAGTTTGVPRIQLCKVTETKLEFLGEMLFEGDIDEFAFTKDDKYITTVLQSGEVIVTKVLDPTKPDLDAETKKLTCVKNVICKTKSEMVKDPRWTTMAAISGGVREKRDKNTLHNFIKNCVMPANNPAEWKAMELGRNSLGFKELMTHKGLAKMFAEDGMYIPCIKTTAHDAETLLGIKKADVPQPAPTQQPTVSSAPQPAAQPVVQPAPQPVVQPATPPATQPATQPAAQSAPQPVAPPATQPATQPVVQPAPQPAAQPAAPPASPSATQRPAQEPKPAKQSQTEGRANTTSNPPEAEKKSSTCSLL